MLHFLHNAIDWLGSISLFIGLVLLWLFIILFVADELIGLFIKDEPKKKPQESNDDELPFDDYR